jgi:hypothetical protein
VGTEIEHGGTGWEVLLGQAGSGLADQDLIAVSDGEQAGGAVGGRAQEFASLLLDGAGQEGEAGLEGEVPVNGEQLLLGLEGCLECERSRVEDSLEGIVGELDDLALAGSDCGMEHLAEARQSLLHGLGVGFPQGQAVAGVCEEKGNWNSVTVVQDVLPDGFSPDLAFDGVPYQRFRQ